MPMVLTTVSWRSLVMSGGKVTGDPFLRMDGQVVFKFAGQGLVGSGQRVLR